MVRAYALGLGLIRVYFNTANRQTTEFSNLNWVNQILKRSFDIVGAARRSGFIYPDHSHFHFSDKIDDGGPAFFSQTRLEKTDAGFDCIN